jgi:hypothetical protein
VISQKNILLEAFVLKSILYVYQNARSNQRKNVPKIYPKNKTFFLPKATPCNVLSPTPYYTPFWGKK